jgi:hypothetical protein
MLWFVRALWTHLLWATPLAIIVNNVTCCIATHIVHLQWLMAPLHTGTPLHTHRNTSSILPWSCLNLVFHRGLYTWPTILFRLHTGSTDSVHFLSTGQGLCTDKVLVDVLLNRQSVGQIMRTAQILFCFCFLGSTFYNTTIFTTCTVHFEK